MIVQDAQFVQAYEAVKQELLQHNELDRKVPIFVSTVDCDSVCALRILVTLLQSEGIYYTIYPVNGWTEIQEKVKGELEEKEDLKNVFFVNCGATEDLVELLDMSSDKHRALVIDSHRPVHTSNASQNNGQVMVLMNDADEEPPVDLGEEESGSDSDSDDSDSDDSHDDGEDGASDDENVPPQQKRQRTGEDGVTKKAARRREKRRLHEDRQRRRIEYYDRGAWRGSPASCVCYELCRQLNKEDNFSLWLSIIGVTDQYIHQLISQPAYQTLWHRLTQQVSQLGNAEMADQVDLEDGGVTTRIPLNRRISQVKDYRFVLMRHWTLHDSMMYSTYVATRLQTWREKGRRNLELLLAKMGCSLAQCKQHYVHMKPSIKDQLADKLATYAPSHNLPDLRFDSFLLEQGYKQAISASDAVHAVSAILEFQGLEDESMFWRAYEAIGPKSHAEMDKGMELAKKVHRSILEDGGSVMGRRAVVSMSTFRVVNLADGEVSDRQLLSKPLALLKMAIFIQDAYRIMQNKVKPVVVVGPEDSEHMCLIVGYTGRPKMTDLSGNRFGNAFAHAQETTKCDMAADYYDQYTVRVSKSDIMRFIAALDAGRHMKA